MKQFITLLILLSFGISVYTQGNDPYQLFGHTSDVSYEIKKADLFRVKNPDSTADIQHLVFDFQNQFVYALDKNDSTIGTIVIENNKQLRWLSADPLQAKYADKSPYSFCSDNPANHMDMDGRDDFTFHTLTSVTSYKINGEIKTQVSKVTSLEIVKNNQANTYSVHNAVYTDDLINKTKTFSESTTGLNNGNNSDAGKLLSENWGAVSGQYSDQSMPIGGSSYQTPGYPGAANLKGSYELNKKEDDYNMAALGLLTSAVPLGDFFEAAGAAKAASVAEGGIETANGIKITGFTKHGLNQTIGNFDRVGIGTDGVMDAIKNPLKINEVRIDELGQASQRFIGQKGTAVINPNTGKVISANPTSTKLANKLLNGTNK